MARLAGAADVVGDLTHCAIHTARFIDATFTGAAEFVSATFTGAAEFGGAAFSGDARFLGATLPSIRYVGPSTLWLLVDGGSPQAPTQLELVRLALTILLGTGGLFGLWLAWRPQRSNEAALLQKERDQADVAHAYELQRETFETTRLHQERVAAANERDAEARRVTDLYTKAVEQLGSEKAPVRGGLYALERLAQDHVEQRQAIINVLCAYLRMPYTLPDDPSDTDTDTTETEAHPLAEYRERTQEREVRLAAQGILAHLHPGDDPDNPVDTFWTSIDLDLTGATLIDLNLKACVIRTGNFRKATFAGYAGFEGAIFKDAAWFRGATFIGPTWFRGATFDGIAVFGRAFFANGATFAGTTFAEQGDFSMSTFKGYAGAGFDGATFTGTTRFDGATFTGTAGFYHATLPSTRYVDHTTPPPWTSFAKARFEWVVPAEVERFVSASKDFGDEVENR